MRLPIILIALCLLLCAAMTHAETAVIPSSRYRLEIKNNVQSPPLKVLPSDSTTRITAGYHRRWSVWDAEVLCHFDLSSIPSDAVISHVSLSVKVASVQNCPEHLRIVEIYKNTRSWSGTPVYNDLGYTGWPSTDLLINDNYVPVGRRHYPQNAELRALVQEWRANPSSNKGLIYTCAPSHYTYYIKISAVDLLVEYETVGPPQPVLKVMPLLDYHALYGVEGVTLEEISSVTGDIGASFLAPIVLGQNSAVWGDVYSGADLSLGYYAGIYGDATASGTINLQSEAEITGYRRPLTPVLQFELYKKTIQTSPGAALLVQEDQTETVNPANYYSIIAEDRATLIFNPGVYNIGDLLLSGENIKVKFNIGLHDAVELNVDGEFVLGYKLKMSFTGIVNPAAVKVHANTNGTVDLPVNAELYGSYTFPSASVNIGGPSKLSGSLYANYITVGEQAVVCKPPFLSDISHSEWAYSPPFHPDGSGYTAVVPQATTELVITPTPHNPSTVVTVNVNPPDVPVAISQNPQYISIALSANSYGIPAYYSLKIEKDPDSRYMIYVNDDSPCPGYKQNGRCWDSAFSYLEDALINAAELGKEIWVAEGVYLNDRYGDGFTEPFFLHPGTEIIGGFKGTETERKPEGSIYLTILYGDWSYDDPGNWPPTLEEVTTLMDDNAYHIVELVCTGKNGRSIKIEGFSIQSGCAYPFENRLPISMSPLSWWGQGINNVENTGVFFEDHYEPITDLNPGGGIYNSHGSPTIEKCNIYRNVANTNGAGIFGRCGPALVRNCLFEENYSYQGDGGGAYITLNPEGIIDGSVFDNNEVGDRELYAGGLMAHKSNITIVNSVFTRNFGPAAGGAVYNDNGTLNIINCTVAGNEGLTGAGGVENGPDAFAEIVNTILWNTGDELEGDSFSVTYSCVEGGYPGEGNISDNPMFVNDLTPKGENGKYGDLDDGLIIQQISPCRGSGNAEDAPEMDILFNYRDITGTVDMGAYSYVNPDNDGVLGKFFNGEFVPTEAYDLIDSVNNSIDIIEAMESGHAHVIEVELPDNKYTRKKDRIAVSVSGLNNGNAVIGNKISVTLYRVDSSQKFRSYIRVVA